MLTQLFCGGETEARSITFPSITRKEDAGRAECGPLPPASVVTHRHRTCNQSPGWGKMATSISYLQRVLFAFPRELLPQSHLQRVPDIPYQGIHVKNIISHFSCSLGTVGAYPSATLLLFTSSAVYPTAVMAAFGRKNFTGAEGRGETSPLEPTLSLKGTSMSWGFRSVCVELPALVQ